MAIKDIGAMRASSNNDALLLSHGNASLSSIFVFVTFFAFGNAVNMRFVKGINFVFVVFFLAKDLAIEAKVFLLDF